ncbi:hypothetical protein MHBO_000255 [Bonamia ostreae]|uniref:FAM192A/Fyv6 N-terminal domain-containing protein n=1 Tax=Bonamia ostreae TaxID=126728 RepID=A0ABV2AG94_9EUKA
MDFVRSEKLVSKDGFSYNKPFKHNKNIRKSEETKKQKIRSLYDQLKENKKEENRTFIKNQPPKAVDEDEIKYLEEQIQTDKIKQIRLKNNEIVEKENFDVIFRKTNQKRD